MPINAKPGSRLVKYKIQDNFLSFWFRFIYRNMSAIEIENFDYVKDLINRDFNTYSGLLLEKMFRQLIAAGKQYNVVGSYWDRKGENEIDIVAVNDVKKRILLAEVKLDSKKIDINKLKAKSEKLLRSYPGYTPDFEKLSLADIERFLQ